MRAIFWLCAALWLPTVALAGDMKAARKAAADRPRALIFNNDGCDVVYEMKQPTAEDLLRCRTAALAGSQVSSIFYCTISSPFGSDASVALTDGERMP